MINSDNMNILKNKMKLHPFLFSIFPGIFFFSMNSQEILFQDILVLSSIFVIITFGIILLCGLFIKKNESIGMIISIGFILFFSYGHIYNLINNNFELAQSILLGIFLVLFAISVFYLLKTKRKLNNLSKIANVVGMTLIVISASNLLLENFQGNYSLDLVSISSKNIELIDSQIYDYPDVYYIILDAYSGQEILIEEFGYDNNEFITFLEKNGFHVVKDSQSNYAQTYFALRDAISRGTKLPQLG